MAKVKDAIAITIESRVGKTDLTVAPRLPVWPDTRPHQFCNDVHRVALSNYPALYTFISSLLGARQTGLTQYLYYAITRLVQR